MSLHPHMPWKADRRPLLNDDNKSTRCGIDPSFPTTLKLPPDTHLVLSLLLESKPGTPSSKLLRYLLHEHPGAGVEHLLQWGEGSAQGCWTLHRQVKPSTGSPWHSQLERPQLALKYILKHWRSSHWRRYCCSSSMREMEVPRSGGARASNGWNTGREDWASPSSAMFRSSICPPVDGRRSWPGRWGAGGQ